MATCFMADVLKKGRTGNVSTEVVYVKKHEHFSWLLLLIPFTGNKNVFRVAEAVCELV